jgi:hypothetical protein
VTAEGVLAMGLLPSVVIVEPEGDVIIELPTVGHGVEVMLGVVNGVIGLMPAFPSSVEPRGIVPLPVADPATEPGVDGVVPEVVPPNGEVPPQAPDVADAPLIVPLDMDEFACMPLTPPPSKLVLELELDPETPAPVMAWVNDPTPKQGVVLAVGPSGPGLIPPGMRPVEPNGIPTGPAGLLVAGTPNGDVVPIPGITVCAKVGPQPSQAVAAAIAKKRFIKTSIKPGRLWLPAGNVDLRSRYSHRA